MNAELNDEQLIASWRKIKTPRRLLEEMDVYQHVLFGTDPYYAHFVKAMLECMKKVVEDHGSEWTSKEDEILERYYIYGTPRVREELRKIGSTRSKNSIIGRHSRRTK